MSEKHLPYIGGEYDRIIFDGDNSVWVRERTCEVDGVIGMEHMNEYDLSCGHANITDEQPNYCTECGAKETERAGE